MKQSYFVGILAFVTLLADVTSIKMACEEHSMCRKGHECCAFGVCTPYVPVGKRCSPVRQIMRVQCPCAIGSSCTVMKTSTSSTKTMSCENIKNPQYLEMVENRDLKHIDSNTVEDQ